MLLDTFWDFFTYIFRIFKRDKHPEYTKLEDNDYEEYSNDYSELELEPLEYKGYKFMFIK